jgi:hypothetical protein
LQPDIGLVVELKDKRQILVIGDAGEHGIVVRRVFGRQ